MFALIDLIHKNCFHDLRTRLSETENSIKTEKSMIFIHRKKVLY